MWKEINPMDTPVWNGKVDGKFQLEKDDELIGVFKSVKTDVGPNKSNLYTFKVGTEGELVQIWGSSILDTRFQNLEEGEDVKVVYLGLVKSEKSGRNYHNYQVFHKRDEEEDVEEEVVGEL